MAPVRSTIVLVQLFELPSAMAHAIQIVHTAAALARRGHAVWLHPRVGRDPRAAPDARAAARAILGAELPETLHVDALPFRHKGLAGLAYRKRLIGHLLRDDGETVFYARQRRQTVALLRLRRALRRTTPIVYELHNLEHVLDGEGGRGARAAHSLAEERRIAREADALVAISEPLADDAVTALGVERPSVIQDGVDLARFADIARPFRAGRAADAAHVVYAGGLYAHKGVEALLCALERLPAGVTLTVVGGNPPEELARLRARFEPSLGARVRFTGQVAAGAVPAELARADLIVLPAGAEARSQRYTSPLKLFEAMATGAPIVAAPAPSYASVLRDGATAFLAADGTPQGLADGVRRALADVERARAIGSAARAAAEAYGWDRRAQAIEAVLQRAAAARAT